MSGTCILSFDCEGKWGMADCLTDHHVTHLTNRTLEATYQRLIHLLDRSQIKATFAFVSAFTFSNDYYEAHKDDFRSPVIETKPWLQRFEYDMAHGITDGWFAPECLGLVKAAGSHEIASHGFTHLPLSEELISYDDFAHEIAMAIKHGPANKNPTFIYPRNQIGYASHLSKFGFIGYRGMQWEPKIATRPLSLLRELYCLEKADPHSKKKTLPIPIPPGYFLNWRLGLRKRIPLSVTLKRWKNLIQDAIQNKRVVHLWTHPHNFIDGADMFGLFEQILQLIKTAVDRDELTVMTQQEYCLNRMGNLQ